MALTKEHFLFERYQDTMQDNNVLEIFVLESLRIVKSYIKFFCECFYSVHRIENIYMSIEQRLIARDFTKLATATRCPNRTTSSVGMVFKYRD